MDERDRAALPPADPEQRPHPTPLVGEDYAQKAADEAIVTAAVAVDADEPMGQDAPLEKAATLAFDESGNGRAL